MAAVTFRETAIDYLVHGQDVAVPLGRSLQMPSGLAIVAADRCVLPMFLPEASCYRL